MINTNHQNSNFQNTQSANEIDFEYVVNKIRPMIPENFTSQNKLGQFDILVKAVDNALEVEGHWFLVNGEIPIKDFLNSSGDSKAST